jgi:hypothetical protein
MYLKEDVLFWKKSIRLTWKNGLSQRISDHSIFESKTLQVLCPIRQSISRPLALRKTRKLIQLWSREFCFLVIRR